MTLAADAPPLDCRDLAGAVAALRERGLRLSTSRRLVLEALFDADGPASAEHIARRSRLDLSSVYRNLELLESHGLVRHVHLGHGPGLYALRGHDEREYLYCERCGAVRALSPEELDPVRERVKERFGYEARFTHFPIVGVCPRCLKRRPHAAPLGRSTQRDQSTMDERHGDEHPHSQEQEHDDGTVHEHAHSEYVEHEHEHSHGDHVHSHGDHVHSHPHAHQAGLEGQHQHGHATEEAS